MRLLILIFLLLPFSSYTQSDKGLRFIENKGQWNDDVDYQARVPGGRVGVSAKGFRILLLDMEALEHRHQDGHDEIQEADGQATAVGAHYFEVNLLGSNPNARGTANHLLEGFHHYFVGADRSRWATQARGFAQVVYENVYDGIDMRVSSVNKDLKYDFIVHPGADPSQIKIHYNGVDGLTQAGDEIEIQTAVGTLREASPYSYQGAGANINPVATQYSLHNGVISFRFPEGYDTDHTLVIDPLLIFSTYSGSTADNWGSTATPGEHGALYSAGVTQQALGGFFPATVGAFQTSNHGSFDMGIIKYDSAGTRFLYATLLGGSNNDSPESLVVDKATGDLIVLGISGSPDYPTNGDAFDRTFNYGTTIFNRVLNTNDQWDIVITRFSPDGSRLIGSTYLGGAGNDGLNHPKQSGGSLSANYGDEMRGDVITDDAGHVYVSSVTSSADFPMLNGFDMTFNGGTTDGLVVKLSPDLSSLEWSTYVGGSGFDAAYSIKFDSDQHIIVAGGTSSSNFPTTSGAYQTTFKGIVDGWVARIHADGSQILQATYTGTSSFDQVYFVDLNATNHIYVYGQTAGSMPVSSGVYHNPRGGQFLQKLKPDLSALEFSTVFGAASPSGLIIPNISPTAFLVNDCNNIYMAGWGGSVNNSVGFWQSNTNGMPVTTDAYQKTTSGSDFYFIVLNGDATQLVYATFLGGNASRTHVDGGTSRFDKYGIVYHAVCSGCSFNNATGHQTSDFPTTPRAHSRVNQSLNCNNAAFKFDLSSLRALFDTNNISLTKPGYNYVCYPEKIVFQNQSTGGKTITWDFDDGEVLVQTNTDPTDVIHQYKKPGQYNVKLRISDLSTCSQTDSISKVIYYFKDNIFVAPDAMVCEGSSFQLVASGGSTYQWTSADGSFHSNEDSPTLFPKQAMTFYVTVTDANGCSRSDTLNIGIIPNVRAAFETYRPNFQNPGYNNICFPGQIQFKNNSKHGETYSWDFNDGTIIDQNKTDTVSLVHGYLLPRTYYVKLKAMNPGSCNKADSVTKAIHYFKENIQVSNDGQICAGTSFALTASGGNQYSWKIENGTTTWNTATVVVSPEKTTRYLLSATDINGCSKQDTVQVKVVERVKLEWNHQLNGSCDDRPSITVRNLTPPQEGVTFNVDFGDGTTSTAAETEHHYERDGNYTIRLTAQREFCTWSETTPVAVHQLYIPNVFTPEGSMGLNDTFRITMGPDAPDPTTAGLPVQLTIVDRWGTTVYASQDYKNDWKGENLHSGIYYAHIKVGSFATCKTWVHLIK